MTIRIFVGCPANNEDLESQAVLDYTLRKHASDDVDLVWMKLSRDPKSFWYSGGKDKTAGWNTTSWATPFSPFRWAIPECCNFEGRAIYLDIDMIAMDDINKLWRQEIKPAAFAVAKSEKTFCCTLFDCAKAKPFIPAAERLRRDVSLYRTVRKSFKPDSVQKFNGAGNWNCLDGEQYKNLSDPEIKIIHCTSIPTQPQLKYALPRLAAEGQKHWCNTVPRPHWRKDIVELFDATLAEAIAAGFAPEKYKTAETFGDYGR